MITFYETDTNPQDKHIENPYEINLMEELTLRGVTQVGKWVWMCICMSVCVCIVHTHLSLEAPLA